jgi:hypothetical protein
MHVAKKAAKTLMKKLARKKKRYMMPAANVSSLVYGTIMNKAI